MCEGTLKLSWGLGDLGGVPLGKRLTWRARLATLNTVWNAVFSA